MRSSPRRRNEEPTQRQLRVGEVIRRTLSIALSRGESHDPELDALLLTVGEVRTSPDLRLATVLVHPLGGRHQDAVLEVLERNKQTLRRIVGRKTGLKFTPELRFRIDGIYDQLDETRRLLSQRRVSRDLEGSGDEKGGSPDPSHDDVQCAGSAAGDS